MDDSGVNSVYIAHRRGVGGLVARALLQELRAAGVDALMDAELPQHEQYEALLLRQIAARPYFLLVLTPETLERCAEPGDWLRLQLEQAQDLSRRVVALASPHFETARASERLRTLSGAALGDWLGQFRPLPIEYGALPRLIVRLRTEFLKAVEPPPPVSAPEQAEVDQLLARLEHPRIPAQALAAQESFERGLITAPDDLPGKLRLYDEALAQYADFPEALARRGAIRDLMGDTPGALADLDAAIRLNANNEIAYMNRGMLHADQGDHDLALADFDAALRIQPGMAVASHSRGVAQLALGDISAAFSDLNQAIRLNPQRAESYFYRGVIHYNRGELEDAMADQSEAIRLRPDFAEALYNRGLVRAQVDLDAAVRDWTEAIRIRPTLADAYYNRGLVRANRGDIEGTMADMQTFLELQPDHEKSDEVRALIEQLRGGNLPS